LNLHGLLHYHLKVARLPIPPYARTTEINEAGDALNRKAIPPLANEIVSLKTE